MTTHSHNHQQRAEKSVSHGSPNCYSPTWSAAAALHQYPQWSRRAAIQVSAANCTDSVPFQVSVRLVGKHQEAQPEWAEHLPGMSERQGLRRLGKAVRMESLRGCVFEQFLLG
jgi:hypothetical protein